MGGNTIFSTLLWLPDWRTVWTNVTLLTCQTARNFSMSGIYSGQYNLPTYEMSLKSDNVEFVCGIVAAILKMSTARNFSMSGISR
jgi:hypothetical protein